MTHFENKEQKHMHEESFTEAKVEQKTEFHKPVEHKHTERGHKAASEKKDFFGFSGLNKFQKFMAVVAVVQVLLLLFVAFKISGLSGTDLIKKANEPNLPVKAAAPSNNPSPSDSADSAALIDDDDVKGDPDAPVTIVEFSDYECPFCEQFYSQTFKQIDQKYIKTGKVKFVYRDFPLGFHAQAQKAAEAAECAGEQGKYYDMHNKLFESGVQGGVDSFKKYAEEIGLNTGEFNSCLDSGKMTGEVKNDLAAGSQLGVSGTPAFFINGKMVVGAQPYSVFEQVIEQALANS
ncbi:MAG: DsbA family protein [Nanoarchaeota archaeon]|nr:DsbA family protein [Nanoarchaeota archaeon]MBU1622484.1 DsbA family protein [Nanoarchaeota archaeon]